MRARASGARTAASSDGEAATSAGPTAVASLYVHAPFCARRCAYCDFAVQVRRTGDVDAWLAALGGELAFVAREGLFALAPRLDTLYVGGGTPSLLGPTAMDGLAERVGRTRLGPETEWTAEANPESLTPEVATAWAKAGVNRLSLGIQSFHEPTLRWMGRLHGSAGARAAVATARQAGIDDLSVDLIFGLPAHLGRDWTADLEAVLALDVPHVSLYGLTVEDGTALGRAVREGREPPVDEERYRAEFLEAARTLAGAGYEQYEVSNFARPGARSRHNSAYWGDVPYLGLGNGAHSFARPVRRWNVRDWSDYEERATRGASPEDGREVLDDEARRLEGVWLALRTDRGWPDPGGGRVGALLAAWRDAGWAVTEGARVRLSPEGWLLLDRLAVELDAALARSSTPAPG